jgi:hypothetical protein
VKPRLLRRSTRSKAEGANRRHSARRLTVVLVALVASAAVVGFAGAKPAFACDTSYWNVSCFNYGYDEGHTITNQGGDSYEYVYTTFSPTSVAIKAIWTTSGGSWISSVALLSGQAAYFSGAASSDKFGCYNNNNQTVFVNCRAGDSY